MCITNVEIKARCNNPEPIRDILQKLDADYKGTDHQIDTYFKVDEGRLKLREGSIENNLIYYRRPDSAEPARSDIHLMPVDNPAQLKPLLTAALGIRTVVDKQREIYFVENVKFHIDEVKHLGSFVEIEAIDENGTIGEAKLQQQCEHYMQRFDLSGDHLLSTSYSDMVPPAQTDT